MRDGETIAREIVRLLAVHCSKAYYNVGGPIVPLADAAIECPGLDHILATTEYHGSAAAIGSAKMTGKPSMLIVTQGPGSFVGALAGAHMAAKAKLPFIGMVGQFNSGEYGFQTGFRLHDVVEGCEVMVFTAGDDPYRFVQKALHHAFTGAGRPVLLHLEQRLMEGPASGQRADIGHQHGSIPLNASDTDLLACINTKQPPLFILGAGYRSSIRRHPSLERALISLVDKMGAGVATDTLNMGAFPWDHAHYVGIIGRLQTPTCKMVRAAFSNTRILLGALPDAVLTDEDRDPYWQNQSFIVIHPDKEALERIQAQYPETMHGIHADVDAVIVALNKQYIAPTSHDTRLNNMRIQDLHDMYLAATTDRLIYSEMDVRPVTDAINRLTAARPAIHVFDGGIAANAASYTINYWAPGSMITPHHYVGTAHNIAAGMAYAAHMDIPPIIAHIGDAAGMYGLAQLAHLQQTRELVSPVLVIVYKNSSHTAINHGMQQRGYTVDTSIEAGKLPQVNYAALATAWNLSRYRLSERHPCDIKDAIATALSLRQITVLDIVMEPSAQIQVKESILTT